jgi:fatty acid desaturase
LPRWQTWLSAVLGGGCGDDSVALRGRRSTPLAGLQLYASLLRVQTTQEEQAPRRPSILRRVLAVLVIVAVVALVIHLIAGLLWAIFYGAVICAAVIAVIWALKTILW